MVWLLVRHRKNKYELYCPDVYGIETWGNTSQDGLEKKRKNWYITSWQGGNEWYDDVFYEFKINVVLETTNLSLVLRYLYEHNCKKEDIKKILDDAKEMFNHYISFQQWGLD